MDASRFRIRLVIPPDPDFEPLSEGAIDVTTHGRLAGTPPTAGAVPIAIEASSQYGKAAQRFELRVE